MAKSKQSLHENCFYFFIFLFISWKSGVSDGKYFSNDPTPSEMFGTWRVYNNGVTLIQIYAAIGFLKFFLSQFRQI